MAVSTIKKTKQRVLHITVTHEDVEAGADSTVIYRSSEITEDSIIGNIAITGSYNSYIYPWSFYCQNGQIISRIRNTADTKTTVDVNYTVLI